MKKLVDELYHSPSADEKQTLQSIEISHLDAVVEPLKLSEALNRILSQYGIRAVCFVVSDQQIVQRRLTYPNHQHSLVTDIPWAEDCSFRNLEAARKACDKVILQKSLERLNKNPGTQWVSSWWFNAMRALHEKATSCFPLFYTLHKLGARQGDYLCYRTWWRSVLSIFIGHLLVPELELEWTESHKQTRFASVVFQASMSQARWDSLLDEIKAAFRQASDEDFLR